MARSTTASSLDRTRQRVVAKLRELRMGLRWTQAELAKRLGLSQARLSEIERGGGSFTAEQLLEVLRLFNVSIDAFIEPQDVEVELQNALARLGPLHLREVDTALPSECVASAAKVGCHALFFGTGSRGRGRGARRRPEGERTGTGQGKCARRARQAGACP